MIVGNKISIIRLLKIIWFRLAMITMVVFLSVGPLVFFQISQFAIDRSIPLIFGTAIAILLGFRTNSAYERWWEARIIWGRILNDSLSLGRLMRDYSDPQLPESTAAVKQLCFRQSAWAYALDRQLKGLNLDDDLVRLLETDEFEAIKKSADPALDLLLNQSRLIRIAKANGMIDTYQCIAIQDLLTRLTAHMGGCHRIKGTNFPTHYSYFTEVFIWIFLLLLGLSLSSSHGIATNGIPFGYASIPAIILIGWVFFMVDGIAQYMQSPFENNRNVIPMKTLATKIEIEKKRLIDGQFDGCGARPAPQSQRHGKAGQTYDKDQRQRAGQYLPEQRRLQRPKYRAGCQPQLRGQAKPFRRDCLPALQQQPRDQRQIKEDVRQHHTVQSINGYRRQTKVR